MRYFTAINLIVATGIGYILWHAQPCESCNAEIIAVQKQLYPWCAALYAILLLAATRKKSTQLVLLAGCALWYPLSLGWHGVCWHESYAMVILPLSLLVLPPLGIGYAYARKEVDFCLVVLYFLALIPAIIFLS